MKVDKLRDLARGGGEPDDIIKKLIQCCQDAEDSLPKQISKALGFKVVPGKFQENRWDAVMVTNQKLQSLYKCSVILRIGVHLSQKEQLIAWARLVYIYLYEFNKDIDLYFLHKRKKCEPDVVFAERLLQEVYE